MSYLINMQMFFKEKDILISEKLFEIVPTQNVGRYLPNATIKPLVEYRPK